MISAYLDRFTDTEEALLIVESLQKEFHISLSELPPNSTVGTWFLVTIEDEKLITIEIDTDKTETMKESIQNRMARLKSKKKSRFKRR